MAEVARHHGALDVAHMRDGGDRVAEAPEETFEVRRSAGCGVPVSHHERAGLANHGRSVKMRGMIASATERQDVGPDPTPWTASSTMLNSGRHRQPTRVVVAGPHPEAAGRDLADLTAEWGLDLDAAVQRLRPATGVFFVMEEGDVQRILAFPHTMVRSDGIARGAHPHPRVRGTFPRVLAATSESRASRRWRRRRGA